MSPRRAKASSPETRPLFSKGQVNRAGKLILDARNAAQREGAVQAVEGLGPEKLLVAFEAVTWWRTLHSRPLSNVAANLRYHVDKEEGRIGGRVEVAQRLKRLETMIDKLDREPKMGLTQMQDIGGVRALLPSLPHVYSVSRRLRKTWTILRVRDYIAEPKPSGYRALHLIVQRNGYPVEVQLRTVRQDAWANQVEEDGRQIGVGLKFGAGKAEIHAYYLAVSDAFAFLDRGEAIPEELAAVLNERYAKIRGTLHRAGGSTP
jgi:putative GTP pyrophosphokinase